MPEAPARTGLEPAMGGCRGGGIRLDEPEPEPAEPVPPRRLLRVFEALFD